MTDEIKRKIKQINSGTTPEGYSKRRWILYPNDWNYVKLNTCLSENKERNKDGVYTKDDVLSVSGERGVVNQIEFMGRSYAGESVLPYHVVETGDIVYTKSPLKQNPYGIIKLNKGNPGIVSTLYAVYHCCNPITAEYLNYFFEIDEYLNSYLFPLVKKGAKNDMKVNNEDVIKGEMALPPIDEQVKIVKILQQCDKVIELHEKELVELQKFKKASLRMLFPKKGCKFPETRFGGFDSEWKWRKVTEIGEIFIGLVTTMTSHYTDNGVLLIRNSDVKDGFFAFGDNPIYLDDEFAKKNSSRKHKVGDVITVHTGDIGTSAVITENEDGSIGFATIVTRPNKDLIVPEYLCSYLNSEAHKNFAMNISTGDGRNNYNLKDYYKCMIPLPTLDEQQKICDYIENLNKIIAFRQREIQEWQQKKKSLMQLLLTGIARADV
ncbi:MAG: restriction endonuclease subunit S [Clostridia bacterium]|nr:restriction endonuclease subunit S [Clostridia bacterium]